MIGNNINTLLTKDSIQSNKFYLFAPDYLPDFFIIYYFSKIENNEVTTIVVDSSNNYVITDTSGYEFVYLIEYFLYSNLYELPAIAFNINNKCTCDIMDLMRIGCKCGGI
jgi:hypothetical protein